MLKPIKRVWKTSVHTAEPMMSQFDNYEIELPLPSVLEKNSDTIWDTFEALQAAETKRLTKLVQ
jgi:hypothetical protein